MQCHGEISIHQAQAGTARWKLQSASAFCDSELKVNDPTSAIKAAWNYNWNGCIRYRGLRDTMDLGRFDGAPSHSVPTLTAPESNFVSIVPPPAGSYRRSAPYYAGGWNVSAHTVDKLSAYAVQPLATLDGGGYLFKVPKHSVQRADGIYSPFDIRSTAFVIYRYNDPFRSDDAWAICRPFDSQGEFPPK